jgi:cystathionine beta-lyase family protein involved in aluminum resistance
MLGLAALSSSQPSVIVTRYSIRVRSRPPGMCKPPYLAGATPGYESKVIFADGTFINGCTSELSADGPLRPPYVVYCQGGTHWTHWLTVVQALALQAGEAA